MPEGRDRLSRNEDAMTTYIDRRRRYVLGDDTAISILEDEPQATGTPFQWRDIPMVGTPGPTRGTIGTPERRRTQQLYRTPRYVGRENLSPVVGVTRNGGLGRGRGRSDLPSWYPRKPLQDITGIVRAIERRRIRLGECGGLTTPMLVLQDRIVDPDISTPSTSSGYPLHKCDISTISPQIRRCPPSIGKVHKILLDITKKADGDSDCLTPQKKLLNNIDIVEKVVMEELRKLKKTPSAKKAEREKKVRTLMSMR